MLEDIEKKHNNGAWTYEDTQKVIAAGFQIHGGKWAFQIVYDKSGAVVK